MKYFILVIVAIILTILFVPFGILFGLISAFRYRQSGRKASVYLSTLFLEIALAIDRFGNAACGDFFNALLIKHGGYHFGVGHETISSALGKNQLRGTLTRTGKLLAGILDWIDQDHCFNSIDDFQCS